MNVGICVCVLLAALSSGSLSLPMSQKAEGEALLSDSLPPPSTNHTRQARSAPVPPSGRLANYNQPQEDADTRNSLSQLLARLMSRKGSPYQTRSSLTSRASGLAPGHRIKDRDYLGWMDFGRRSAEEYEYSS
ncbi:cholecystokinin a [Trachinotus anak]|uniref:cholecystokinin a n=1 Tax=Trachinotus anak TaxID=443729 RepID=UPI0039F1DFF2